MLKMKRYKLALLFSSASNLSYGLWFILALALVYCGPFGFGFSHQFYKAEMNNNHSTKLERSHAKNCFIPLQSDNYILEIKQLYRSKSLYKESNHRTKIV